MQILLAALLTSFVYFGAINAWSLGFGGRSVPYRIFKLRSTTSNLLDMIPLMPPLKNDYEGVIFNGLKPANAVDAAELSVIIKGVIGAADQALAFDVVAENLDWLYTHNVPELYAMARERGMMDEATEEDVAAAYTFIFDFLEINAKEMNDMMFSYQTLLKKIIEAAKLSELTLQTLLSKEKEKILSPGFMTYLDSELDHHDAGSPIHSLIYAIKLQILDVLGESKGEDVLTISKVIALPSTEEIKSEVNKYLRSHSREEKELFSQSVDLILKDIKQRDQNDVDPALIKNLNAIAEEVQKILSS